MENQRWPQIKSLFQQALEHPPAERDAFLDAACEGDAELRAEVESLLAADAEDTVFMEEPAAFEQGLLHGQGTARQIGAYRLVRELGQGGMGQVYLAERADAAFQKRVAIKLMRRDVRHPTTLQRFKTERHILARLEHPNIARLLDGGVTDEGAPYLVMEYVEGESLMDYANQRHLSLQARIDLFRVICEAVHYAHQNLVIHRDLKPSNIFVATGEGTSSDGTVKLLDFGIAKLLDEDTPDTQVPVTQTGLQVMTPAYASPEQVRGAPITTASDVYSLGVLLYELLTGQRPYHFETRAPTEIERVICEHVPERPSTMATERDRPQLRGDLDTIVLKALHKVPGRRYESASALAEDLRRHVVGLPVLARPDTLGYRLKKFVGRHRVGVLAATAVVVLVSGLVGFYTVQLTQERDRVQVEAAKAAQTLDFVRNMLGAADPGQEGRDVTVVEVLEQAARQVETELTDQPEVEWAVRHVIGHTYQELGYFEQAEPHFRRSLALRQQAGTQAELAQGLHAYGLLKHWQGAYDSAGVYYQQALDVFDALDAPSENYARALNDLGLLHLDEARYDAAVPLVKRALHMKQQVVPKPDLETGTFLQNLGSLYWNMGNLALADSFYQAALTMTRPLADPESSLMAYLLNNMGMVRVDQGRLTDADSLLQASLAVRRVVFGDEHPSTALLMYNIGKAIKLPQGAYAEAEVLLTEALGIYRQAYPDGHTLTARALLTLGEVHLARNIPQTAEPFVREALAVQERLQPSGAYTGYAKVILGRCLTLQGRYAEAEAVLLAGHDQLRDREGDWTNYIKKARSELAALYQAWGKPDKAQGYQDE